MESGRRVGDSGAEPPIKLDRAAAPVGRGAKVECRPTRQLRAAHRRRARTALQWLLSATAVCLLLSIVDAKQLRAVAGTIDGRKLLEATALVPVMLALRALRWHVLANSVLEDVTLWQSTRTYLVGVSLNVLTPVGAGEVVRGAWLRRGHTAELAGLSFVDKLMDVGWVGALGLIGWTVAGLVTPGEAAAATALVMVCAAALLAPRQSLLRKVYARFVTAGRLVRPATMASVAAMSLACQLLLLVQAYVLLVGTSRSAVHLEALAVWPAVTLSTAVPALLGGLGTREVSAAVLLPPFGVDAASASLAAFAQFVTTMLLPALVSAPFVIPAWRRKNDDG